MSTPRTKPVPQTGADLLVKSLEAQGVEYVFGTITVGSIQRGLEQAGFLLFPPGGKKSS